MTQVILLMSCGHWCKGLSGLVNTRQICKLCTVSKRHVTVVGEASPHQLTSVGSDDNAG